MPWWIRLFGALIGASVGAERHEADAVLRNPRRRHPPKAFANRRCVRRPARPRARGGQPVRVPDADRSVAHQWSSAPSPRRAQRRGLRGWAGDAGAGAAQQAPGRLPDAFRIRPWRQRLRGHRLPARSASRRGLKDPTDAGHGIDLKALAMRYVDEYARYKSKKKTSGERRHPENSGRQSPGIQGSAGQSRPTARSTCESCSDKRGEYNVFHQYYQLVGAGSASRRASRATCTALISTPSSPRCLLRCLWQPYRGGAFSERALETAAFTIFLYPRMLGCAAEIDDHLEPWSQTWISRERPRHSAGFVA